MKQLIFLFFAWGLLLSGCARRQLVLTGTAEFSGEAAASAKDVQAETGLSAGNASADNTAVENPPDLSAGEGRADRQDSVKDSEPPQTNCEIAVYICGAVHEDGVYTLQEGARVADALAKAGGFRPDADTQWCNLARVVSDGEMIRILSQEETSKLKEQGVMSGEDMIPDSRGDPGTAAGTDRTGSPDMGGRININTAGLGELVTLPGIGEAKAKDIIAFREENGPFERTEEICKVKGIGEKVFSGIKDMITVS